MRQHYQNQLFSFITFALLTLISVSSFTATAQATINPSGNSIIYVNTAVIGGTGDGSSWANAIPELADALQYARTQYNTDTTVYDVTPLQIYIAKGTYKPLYHAANGSYTTDGSRDNSFVMVKNVQIYGGFDPANNITDLTHNRILPDNNATVGTILSGDIGTLNDNTDNAYHVVISSGNVGNALLNGVTITEGNANGGYYSIITVNGNAVRRNTGGGMCNISSSPVLTHVNITNNTASFGGGMDNVSSSPVLTNVSITNNTANSNGGGMYNYSSSSPILTNVNITNNTANNNGGGMRNDLNSSPQVYNSIVYGNMKNNGNADNFYNDNSTPQFYNSLIEGSGGSADWDTTFGTDGGNNLDATTSPFTDAANGDYSLAAGSPAINGGNNQYWIDHIGALTGNETDIVGNPRIIGGSIDMGAYESTYEDVSSVQGQVEMTVPYGTALDDLVLPSTHTVQVTLNNGNILPAEIDPNSANWIYVSGSDGQGYDALRAGSYIFHAELVAPDISSPDWYSNTKQLKVEIQLTIAKGTPQLSSTWNGAPIDAGIGLALTYGDEGALGISHNNTDLDDDADIALIAGDGVLNLADLQEVQTLMSGTGRLRISVPETDNFEEAVLEFEVRVAPKALTITAVDQQKTYGEPLLPDGTAFTVDGLLPMDEVATASLVSDGFDAQVDAGTYTIVASAAQGMGLANYNISYEEGTLTVNQKALTITANDRNKVYGEDLVLGNTEFAATGLVNGDTVSAVTLASDGAAASALADNYAIVGSAAQGTGLANYNISYEEGTLTVAKGTPQLSSTWNGVPIDAGTGIALTYGDEGALGISHNNSDIGVEADIALIAGDGVLNVADLQEVQTLMSGTGRLRISVPETDNFEEAVLEFEVRVAPKALTITAVDQQKTYGEQLLPDGTEFTVDGLLPWDEIATVSVVSDGLDAQADAGTYTIVATAAQGTGLTNYTINYEEGTLTVAPKALTITADDQSKVYGSNDPALTYQLSTPLLPGDSFTGALVRATGENVGEYVIEQGDLAAGKNYSLSFVPAVFRIAPATITGVTFSDASFVYDGSPKSLAISGTLPAGTEVIYSNNSRTDAGTQQVTATISGSNYLDLVLTAELEITPATITSVNFTNASFVYDGTPKSLAISGTLPTGTEVVYSNNSRTDVGVQEVTATISGSNYQELVLSAELEITPATITSVNFTNASFVYDGSPKSLAISGPLPTGTDVIYSNNSRTDVGMQEVTATISGSNYQELVLTAELEITKAAITGITFSDASFVYDGSAKALAISGTLPAGTDVVYSNNSRTEVGLQQVTATVSGSNYHDLGLTAELEIVKAPQVISFVTPSTLAHDAGTVPLEVSSSSGLPVTLSIDDSEIAHLDDHNLIVKRLGTVKITATQAGNNNYLPAEPVVQTIRIIADAGSKLPIRVHQAVSPNGDGINDYLMIEGIADYPENRVTIFDKSGKILAEIESYNNRERAFTGEYVRDGTYYYYLDVKDGNTWKREKGFFVVRR